MKKNDWIFSFVIFLLFTISFFVSDAPGASNSQLRGVWTIPFILISLFPAICGFIVQCLKSKLVGDIVTCNFIPSWIIYFVVSGFISSLPILFLKKAK